MLAQSWKKCKGKGVSSNQRGLNLKSKNNGTMSPFLCFTFSIFTKNESHDGEQGQRNEGLIDEIASGHLCVVRSRHDLE